MTRPSSRSGPDRNSHMEAHGQFISSNQTANMFLGGRRRSYGWMDPTPGSESSSAIPQPSRRPTGASSTSASPPIPKTPPPNQAKSKHTPPLSAENGPSGVVLSPARSDQSSAESSPQNARKRSQYIQNAELAKRHRSEGSSSMSMSPSISHGRGNPQSSRSPRTPASELRTRDRPPAQDRQPQVPSEEARQGSLQHYNTQLPYLPPGASGEISPTLDNALGSELQQASHQSQGQSALTASSALSPPSTTISQPPAQRFFDSYAPPHLQPLGGAEASTSVISNSEYQTQSQHPSSARTQGGRSTLIPAGLATFQDVPLNPAIAQQINFFHAKYPTTSPYFSGNCKQKFQAFAQYYNTHPPHPSPLPINRADMIKDAIDLNDHFFLIIHQVVCLHASPGNAVPQPLKIPSLIPAMRVLNRLFEHANPLHSEMETFLCQFPIPISEFSCNFPELYQITIAAVKNLFQFLPNWDFYNQLCLRRRFPLLVGELVTVLGIPSPILMELVHTACVTNLWGPTDAISRPYVDQARTTFYDNAKVFMFSESRDLVSFRSTDEGRFIAKFISLDGDLSRARAKAASCAGTSGFPVLGPQNVSHLQPNQLHHSRRISNSVATSSQAPSQPSSSAHSSRGSHFAHPSSHFGASSEWNISVPLQQAQYPRFPTLPTASPSPQFRNSSSAVQGTNFAQHTQAAAPNHPPRAYAHSTHSLQSPLTGLGMSPSQESRPFIQSPSQQIGPYPAMNGQQASTAHPGLLIPQIGSRLPHPRVENYQTTALHQSHLMSPILAPIDLSPMASDATLYQLVKSYIIAPHRLDHNNDVIHFLEFELSKDDFARVARTNNPGMPSAARTLRTDSCQYRVRCCTLPSKQGAISELEWVSSDTSFPEFATLKMNDTYLEVRRKQHFAKDRPVDVTDMLKQGSNRLEVYLNVGFNDKKRAGYGVAIECVGSITIEDIKVAVKENCFGETAVLASLRSSLSQPAKGLVVSGTTAGDSDDDIIMVVPETRTIGLRDPISLTALGLLPVRGVNCKHHECFDLDNFLQSRTRTPLPANTFKTLSLPTIRTTSPDVWTCPICKSDVRPCNLGVDLWMLGVREKLQKMGKLNANRIVVQADGSWKVKPDSTTSSTSATTRSNAATQAAATQAAAASNTSPKLRAQLSTGSRITDYALSLDDSDDD